MAYCRDCCYARVTGQDVFGEPLCRCERGHWGPASWECGLVAPSCDTDFELAAEEPGDLDFWGLAKDCGLEPEPRHYRKAQTTPLGASCEAKQ